MTKDFIPYEEALALKELGFDEPCLGYYQYNTDGKYPAEFYYHKPNVDSRWNPLCINSLHPAEKETNAPKVSAPLYQQAFRWFREKYEIYAIVFRFPEGFFTYEVYIKKVKTDFGQVYKTHEEAELACLRKLIEIVKQKLCS